VCAAGLVASIALVPLLLQPAAAAAASEVGRVEGVVLSKATKIPVPGATVRLPDLGVTVITREDGSFSFPEAFEVGRTYRRVRAVVSADGFGTWTLRGAPIWANDTLRLHVELGAKPFDHRVQTPQQRRTPQRRAPAAAPTGNTCTGWDYSLVPPQTIWVWRSATNVAEQYDFLFYAQHVLPNEWLKEWDPDSLAAGAIAVKTYAWYMAGTGHARFGGPDCADIYDDWHDQLFDPTWSAASTDLAVDATFGSILRKNGQIFATQYWGGDQQDRCAPVTKGEFAGRMSQWGSQNCAVDDGLLWPSIDTTFYTGTGWKHKNNLFLDGSLQSPPMYPWLTKNGTAISRLSGGAYDDASFLQVTPKDGTKGVVYQSRPYLGEAGTAYTVKAGFRCPTSSPSDCSVTFRVVAKDAGAKVRQTYQVSVPNDAKWRTYAFTPDAPGIDHTLVEVSFISYAPFDLDKSSLTAPYAG
jgi:hypothetical protein